MIGKNPSLTDLVVLDRDQRIRLWVEVKRFPELTPDEAAEMRCWRLEDLPRRAPFLVVTPRAGFLWSASAPDAARPEFVLNMRAELAPEFERTGIAPEAVQPLAFQMLVSSWLGDVLDHLGPRRPSWEQFEQAGLGALHESSIVVGDAA